MLSAKGSSPTVREGVNVEIYALPDGLSLPKFSCEMRFFFLARESGRQIIAWDGAGRSPAQSQVSIRFNDQAHVVRDRG